MIYVIAYWTEQYHVVTLQLNREVRMYENLSQEELLDLLANRQWNGLSNDEIREIAALYSERMEEADLLPAA